MNTNAVKFFSEQKTNEFSPDTGLILAVWEIINPGNIGQIIRLGHNVGAHKILFVNADYKLVILETCTGSKNIFSVELPKKAIILAGSESHGIPIEVIEKGTLKIYIPMRGDCKSMNVSQALSVAAFEWYRQEKWK